MQLNFVSLYRFLVFVLLGAFIVAGLIGWGSLLLFPVWIGAMAFAHFKMKCPQCKNYPSAFPHGGYGPWWGPSCRFCGRDLRQDAVRLWSSGK